MFKLAKIPNFKLKLTTLILELNCKKSTDEAKISTNEAKWQHNAYRGQINKIHDGISTGRKIRSKCLWYEVGGNLANSFLTLEKRWATQNIVRKVLSNKQEIVDWSKIKTHIYQFYQHLYNDKQNINEDSVYAFLNDLTVPSLTTEQLLSC